MKIEKVNIGLVIEQKMNELGVSKSELSRRIGVANQNINRIFDKPSIDTDKLIAISEALDYNFFREYVGEQSAPISAVASGDHSAASVNGNASVSTSNEVLAERVNSLERLVQEKDKLIEEKERTIKILMEK